MKKKLNRSAELTRDAILARLENKVTIIEVPEWGATIRIRPPTFQEMCAMKLDSADDSDFKARLVIGCCVDLLPEDIDAMRKGNGFRFAELSNAVYANIGGGQTPGN